MEYTDINNLMKYIKKIMIDKDLRQKDIAEKTGLSIQTISNLLACRRDGITLDTLNKLCRALDCKLYIEIKWGNTNARI